MRINGTGVASTSPCKTKLWRSHWIWLAFLALAPFNLHASGSAVVGGDETSGTGTESDDDYWDTACEYVFPCVTEALDTVTFFAEYAWKSGCGKYKAQ